MMPVSAPSFAADATRPITMSPMPGAGGVFAVIERFNRATSQQSIVARQTAITVPGAVAPGQHEEYQA